MPFEIEVDEYELAGTRSVAETGGHLQALFAYRREHDGLTQQAIADKMCVDKSRVNRCLNGFNNLTLSTVGEIIHAMDGVMLQVVFPKEQIGEWRIVRVAENAHYGYFATPNINKIGTGNAPETMLFYSEPGESDDTHHAASPAPDISNPPVQGIWAS